MAQVGSILKSDSKGLSELNQRAFYFNWRIYLYGMDW